MGVLDTSFLEPGVIVSSTTVAILISSGVSVRSTVAQLSATDVSARTTMKGAAKCDKHCELQNSVNQQGLERTLRFQDIPESMPASVSTPHTAGDAAPWVSQLSVLCVRVP